MHKHNMYKNNNVYIYTSPLEHQKCVNVFKADTSYSKPDGNNWISTRRSPRNMEWRHYPQHYSRHVTVSSLDLPRVCSDDQSLVVYYN